MQKCPQLAIVVLVPLLIIGAMTLAQLGIMSVMGGQLTSEQWLRGAILGWLVAQSAVLIIIWRARNRR